MWRRGGDRRCRRSAAGGRVATLGGGKGRHSSAGCWEAASRRCCRSTLDPAALSYTRCPVAVVLAMEARALRLQEASSPAGTNRRASRSNQDLAGSSCTLWVVAMARRSCAARRRAASCRADTSRRAHRSSRAPAALSYTQSLVAVARLVRDPRRRAASCPAGTSRHAHKSNPVLAESSCIRLTAPRACRGNLRRK